MSFVEIDGRRVYYELHESQTLTRKPPLVMMAGIGASCRGWLPLQVPELSRNRDVLVFDHRGAGESEDPGTPFSTADLARDAVQLMDALEIGAADVLGAFMGGMVAQELALGWPDRLRRLVLVGTYARPDAKRRMLLGGWAELARGGLHMGAMLRERLVWTLQDETFEQTDLIEAMLEFFEKESAPTSPDLFARQCEASLAHDGTDRLRQIPHPALVICGRKDQLTPPKFHRELADEIPGADLVTMSYGGHLVMAESAERFNQTVLQFLDD